MQLSLVTCLFVLTSRSINKKRNDEKILKVLVNKNSQDLLRIDFDESESIKKTIRKKIKDVTGSNSFHLEQVYTLGEDKYYSDNKIDILYMGLTNEESIKKLDSDYELIEFKIVDNNVIILGNDNYSYKTETKIKDNSTEYYHKVNVKDIELEKKLIELLIVFKHLRFRMDNTDVCFKLLPKYFTLEDVRLVYELIKDTTVDKSNFRKRIAKYCVKSEEKIVDKGYRPSQVYMFNQDSIDIWL